MTDIDAAKKIADELLAHFDRQAHYGPVMDSHETVNQAAARVIRELRDAADGWLTVAAERERVIDQQAQRIAELEADRRDLAQGIWEARAALGFDNDGNSTPGASIVGMGAEWFALRHVNEARQARKDFEDEIAELEAERGEATVEWGVHSEVNDHVWPHVSEESAHYGAGLAASGQQYVVRRTVTAWLPVETEATNG